jgi:hypothetical protein
VVRYGSDGVTHHRCPIGPLLAVDDDTAGGAWAVGSAGQIVHAARQLRTWQLDDFVWLRAVLTFDFDDVWVGGDRTTLLHFDGQGWARVKAQAMQGDQSITALTVGPHGDVWALGEKRVFQVPRGAVVEGGP